jgi:ornithine decarboxylase
MELLDIGGGFPGDEVSVPSFEQIAAALNPVLESLFIGVKVIAEPGRYFACASHTLAANVYSKRVIGGGDISTIMKQGEVETDWTKLEYQYYINDGLYQSFNCIFYDHAIVKPYHLRMGEFTEDEEDEQELNFKSTTIFGPTCDSLDCIAKKIPFPEMSIGDWVYFTNMGAYTCAAASSFNGFTDWRTVYTTFVDYGAIIKNQKKGLMEEREEPALQEK